MQSPSVPKRALLATVMVSIGCAASPAPVHTAATPAPAPVEHRPEAASVPAAAPVVAIGEAPPEFPTGETSWVNGSPVTLANAHGNVVLVESWHRL